MKRLKESKYFHFGTMLLTVIAISIVLLAVVLNLSAVGAMLKTVGNVFAPIVIGAVLAYLLNPVMNFLDRRLGPWLTERKRFQNKPHKAKSLSRGLSLLFAMLVFFVLVYEFCSLLLPQLYESLMSIVNNFTNYYTVVENWVLGILEDNPAMQAWANQMLDDLFVMLKNWVNNDLLSSLETILKSLTTSVMTIVGGAVDLIIGICAAVYILWSRDTFLAQSKKLVVALFRTSTADHLMDLGRRIHKVFSGFIIGKLVDSLIIGVLCYIGMLVLRLPYPALVATVIGVTNVIPFFGPFIGAIPSIFLILLVEPIKAVYFTIFVLFLQQVDGNIIGPRILGDTIGISGFWVLVSITVAGGLFGFAGMLLGVPVFAVLYMLLQGFVTARLREKDLPVQTEDYRAIRQVEELEPPEQE